MNNQNKMSVVDDVEEMFKGIEKTLQNIKVHKLKNNRKKIDIEINDFKKTIRRINKYLCEHMDEFSGIYISYIDVQLKKYGKEFTSLDVDNNDGVCKEKESISKNNDTILKKAKSESKKTTQKLRQGLTELNEAKAIGDESQIVIEIDNKKLEKIGGNIEQINSESQLANKRISRFLKRIYTDKIILSFIFLIFVAIGVIMYLKYSPQSII